jgi:hypothetical protein
LIHDTVSVEIGNSVERQIELQSDAVRRATDVDGFEKLTRGAVIRRV